MKLSYLPSKDEMILKIGSVQSKPNVVKGSLKIWSDEKHLIDGISITEYTKILEEFRKNLHVVKLGGLWQGVKITDADIRKARRLLLTRLEEQW
jgi:hypothetical protein